MTQAVTELVVDGSGALSVLGQYERGMERAGQATERSTGALSRFEASMQRAREAQEKGLAIQTESIQRRSAEQRALERWQGHVDKTMRRELQLRREAERAAVDMSNAVVLGYTTQEKATATLIALEQRHAAELRQLAGATNAAGAANDNLRTRVDEATRSLQRQRAAAGANTFQTANIAAQFQDIAVTSAMGMSPLQIALQQGTQLSAVLNTMQNPVKGLAAAFMSVLNPVSLVTIAVIAAGAALIQYFSSGEKEVDNIDAALKAHADNIADIKARWGDAASGVTEYVAKSRDLIRAESLAAGDRLREQIDALAQSILEDGDLIRTTVPEMVAELEKLEQAFVLETDQATLEGMYVEIQKLSEAIQNANRETLVAGDRFGLVKDELDAFAESVRAGEADFIGLQDALARRRLADPANEELRRIIRTINELGDEEKKLIATGADLQRSLEGNATALDKITVSARNGAKGIEEFTDAMERLNKLAAPPQSDRQSAAAALEIALKRARGWDDALLAISAYEEALKRIENREAGAAAPIPTPRPNDIQRLDWEDEALDKQASAYDRVVESARNRIEQMQLEIEVVGKAGIEADALRLQLDLLQKAQKDGATVTPEQRAEIEKLTASYRDLATELAKLQALDEIDFARSLIGLSDGDAEIVSALRQWGLDANTEQGRVVAGQLRVNQVLSQTRDELEAMQDVGKDAFMSIIDLLYESGDAGEKLIGIFANISKQFAKMGMERLWKSWTEGSMFDGMTGGATGSFSPVQAASVGREIGQAIAPSITSSLNDNLTSFAAAIRKVESGSYAGNYGAVGPMVKSGSYAGDHAYGAYQVMGRNIEAWTKEATGTALSIQEFLDSKSAQDRVFANKFGQSVEKFGTFADGASVWFSGRPLNRAGSASDGYNTVPEYVQKAEAALAGYNPSAMRGAVKGGVLDAGRAMQYDSFQDRFDTGAPTVLNQGNLKDLLGVGGAAFGAFAGGYQSGRPIGGALSGAMAGFGAAPMLANLGLGAAAGPVGLIGGAIIGLIGGILGKSKQKKEEMRKAQQELESQMGAITELIATATGNFMGAFEKSLMSTSDEFAKAIALAEKARNTKLVGELKDARDEFFRTMEETWSRGFEGMIASMNAGLGLDGEFLSGMDAVEKMRESLVGFVNDAKMFAEANGDIVGYMENARKAYEAGGSAVALDPTQMAGYRRGNMDVSADYRAAVERWAAEIERYQIDVFTEGAASTRDNPSGTPVGQVYDSVEALRSRLMDFGVVFDDLGQIVRETTNEVDLAASVERAREAAIKSALAALSGAKEFTEMEKAVLRLEGAAASLPSLLEDLGMSAEEAAAAIDRSLIVAMDKLRMSMETDLLRSINELSDMGFMNDLLDAQTSLQARLRDAQASGADVSLVFTELGLRLRQIAGDAELTDDQLRQLADVFPMLSGELMGLIGMSAGNTSAAVSAAKAALDEAKANLRSAYEEEKRLLEQVVSRHDALIKSLQRFRDDLRLDANLSPLDPYQRMLEAQKQFQETAALALTGDEDALGRLEDVSRAYLTEARSYYATSEGYYSIFTEVESILDQALSLAGDQLSEAERQLAALDAQVSELITLNDTALTVVDAINALADAEAAHAAAQASHASAQDQRISDMMKLVAKMMEDQKRDADYRVSPEVEKIYQDIVGRFPEKDGADYWQRIFDSGMDVNEIYRRFIHDVIALGATPNPSAVAQYGIGDVGSSGLPGYSSGGFTGFGGLNQVMGVVHGQEFVAHAEATRRWRPQLEAMNAGSYRGGGQDNAPLIAEIRALRQQVADLERSNAQVTAAAAQEQIAATEGTTQAVNRQADSAWRKSKARAA